MKNIKRVHDLQKHNLDMKQLSNSGKQVIITCQMLFRENYRGSLMGRSDGVRLTGEDLMGSPKPRSICQSEEGDDSYMTRDLESRISVIFPLTVKLFSIFSLIRLKCTLQTSAVKHWNKSKSFEESRIIKHSIKKRFHNICF